MTHRLTRLPIFKFLSLAVLVNASFGPALAAGEAGVEQIVIKGSASFAFDGATLAGPDADALMAKVAALNDVSWQAVVASGHTDSVGRAAYNRRLSLRRAVAVKSYLVSKGLAPSMVQTQALASTQPVAPNDTAEGRARNRRADVEFRGVRVASR